MLELMRTWSSPRFLPRFFPQLDSLRPLRRIMGYAQIGRHWATQQLDPESEVEQFTVADVRSSTSTAIISRVTQLPR